MAENKFSVRMDRKKMSQANIEMGRILDSLKIVAWRESKYRLLPKNHPKFVGRGDLALVLKLGGGIVGKVAFYSEIKEYPEDYILRGLYVGCSSHIVESTVSSLREMGFDNVLDHVEFKREEDTHPNFYHLCPDLNENGGFVIHSIENFPFDKVVNADELKNQVKVQLAMVKSKIKSDGYIFNVDHHGTKDKPSEALRRMFIGRIDRTTNRGELFLADLDHLSIYKFEG